MNEAQFNFIRFFQNISEEIHQTAKEKGWWDQESSDGWIEKEYSGEDTDKWVFTKIDMKEAFKTGQQNPERNEGELLMLTVSELAEGMEGLRKDLQSDHIPGFKMIEEELADAIIRIADHAEKYKYRVAEAIIAKMEFNKTRSHKHGGKKF